MVADHNEELIAEIDILRQELGMLITTLRGFAHGLKHGQFKDLTQAEVATAIEEIING